MNQQSLPLYFAYIYTHIYFKDWEEHSNIHFYSGMTESIIFMNAVCFLFSILFICMGGYVYWLYVCVYRINLPRHIPEKQWIYFNMNKVK